VSYPKMDKHLEENQVKDAGLSLANSLTSAMRTFIDNW